MSNTVPVLSTQDLTKTYTVKKGLSKGIVKALQGVNLTLAKGSTLAVIGESGCGKSTLARQLMGIESPDSGIIKIDNQEVDTKSAREVREMRKKVQIIFQNPYASLNPRQRIGDILEAPLKINTELSPAERKDKINSILESIGLGPDYAVRFAHQLSGGQRQRVAIGRGIILNPEILILDEPVSALDLSVQAQVLNLLRKLQEELNLSYIFISHDISVVKHFTEDVVVMYLGKIVEKGKTEKVLSNPLHPYTKALLASVPVIGQTKEKLRLVGEIPSPLNPPSGCPFRTRCPIAESICAESFPVGSESPDHSLYCHLNKLPEA